MPWKKVSSEMTVFLDQAMAPFRAERRQMFGCPCYFANGNMFTGLHQDDLILRLSPEDRQELLSTWDEATLFEPMEGRPMREYVVVPNALYNDPPVFTQWLERSLRYAESLSPKELKPRKKQQKA